jgi:hypothetical protein
MALSVSIENKRGLSRTPAFLVAKEKWLFSPTFIPHFADLAAVYEQDGLCRAGAGSDYSC